MVVLILHCANVTTSLPLHQIVPINVGSSPEITDGVFNYVEIDSSKTDYNYTAELTPEQERRKAAAERIKKQERDAGIAFASIIAPGIILLLSLFGWHLLNVTREQFFDRCSTINEQAQREGWSRFRKYREYIFCQSFVFLVVTSIIFL